MAASKARPASAFDARALFGGSLPRICLIPKIWDGHGTAVATERGLEATVRRLAAYPQALNARFAEGKGAPADARYCVRTGGGKLGLLALTC